MDTVNDLTECLIGHDEPDTIGNVAGHPMAMLCFLYVPLMDSLMECLVRVHLHIRFDGGLPCLVSLLGFIDFGDVDGEVGVAEVATSCGRHNMAASAWLVDAWLVAS